MRIAVLSDIHANLQALEAVAVDLAGADVDQVWSLGDVVGYGGDPGPCLDWALDNCHLAIKGNHDEAVATLDVVGFNRTAAVAARAHASMLTPEQRAKLFAWPALTKVRGAGPTGQLPEGPPEVAMPAATFEAAARTLPEGLEIEVVHASPDDPLREYVQPKDVALAAYRWVGTTDVLLMGHTHRAFFALTRLQSGRGVPQDRWKPRGFGRLHHDEDHLLVRSSLVYTPDEAGRTPPREGGPYAVGDNAHRPLLIVNPGSVGQPRDHDPRASYVILDTAGTVELRRVEYDIRAAADAILRAQLAESLATRLFDGT